MPTLRVRLFGRIDVRLDDVPVDGFDARKSQELFAYLLLHRRRLHCRETLADLLWGEAAAVQSRKYLRQALWLLQAAVCPRAKARATDTRGRATGGAEAVRAEAVVGPLLRIEPEWIGVDPSADVWLDVDVFERAYTTTKGIAGAVLDCDNYATLCGAVELVRGELLEGWYQDWCVRERDRFQEMYLAMLDKLTDRCEAAGDIEAGLEFSARSLACDRARERTYRRMMRLRLAGGDRTGALRLYDRCVEALREELGVGPEGRTVGLWEAMRAEGHDTNGHTSPSPERWVAMLADLRRLQATVAEIEVRLQDDIEAVLSAAKEIG